MKQCYWRKVSSYGWILPKNKDNERQAVPTHGQSQSHSSPSSSISCSNMCSFIQTAELNWCKRGHCLTPHWTQPEAAVDWEIDTETACMLLQTFSDGRWRGYYLLSCWQECNRDQKTAARRHENSRSRQSDLMLWKQRSAKVYDVTFTETLARHGRKC